ncbi:MAG: hypothetical protein ACUZ8E_16235 [Candidatus Anammoxibacter sp.]
MRNVGLSKEDNESNPTMNLGQWSSGWGLTTANGFAQIYEKIEKLYQWS